MVLYLVSYVKIKGNMTFHLMERQAQIGSSAVSYSGYQRSRGRLMPALWFSKLPDSPADPERIYSSGANAQVIFGI